MKYFSINELVRSSVADENGIDNTPPEFAVRAMSRLIDRVLDPVRVAWGRPISVNSGYRSVLLNAKVGGKDSSQHIRGEAADISAGSKGENKMLFNLILSLRDKGVIVFDQLIDEKNFSWIHISYTAGNENRGQVLRL